MTNLERMGRWRTTGNVLVRNAVGPLVAVAALVFAMGGTWSTPRSAYASPVATGELAETTTATARRAPKKEVTGRVNLNTATEEQLMRLPTVGPAKAERIVTWRKKHGAFKRPADLRRVKGFGYKTFKRLEPLLAVHGETTLAPR